MILLCQVRGFLDFSFSAFENAMLFNLDCIFKTPGEVYKNILMAWKGLSTEILLKLVWGEARALE